MDDVEIVARVHFSICKDRCCIGITLMNTHNSPLSLGEAMGGLDVMLQYLDQNGLPEPPKNLEDYMPCNHSETKDLAH